MRSVFFISNRTAITAETMGHSLLAQFEDTQFREIILPYIDSPDKIEAVVERINRAAREEGERPIVLSSLADPVLRERVLGSDALVLDLFHAFLGPLVAELHVKPFQKSNRSHRLSNMAHYESRIDAINFTLLHDDGAYIRHYDESDVILIGVSRSGKTPTCLYLAMHFGIRTANYPLTEEDLGNDHLPMPLRRFADKLYGLTTDYERLHKVRTERRPNSRYASLAQCRHEVRAAEDLFRIREIPFLNISTMSVEEIATRIVQDRGLRRYGI